MDTPTVRLRRRSNGRCYFEVPVMRLSVIRERTAHFEGKDVQVSSPAIAAELFGLVLREDLLQEELWVLCVNVKNEALGLVCVYRGTKSSCITHLGDLFATALVLGAYAIVVGHNHPSGDTTPSAEDIKLTSQMVQAGTLLDVEVLDHLIVCGPKWRSLREMGVSFERRQA